LSQPFDPSRPPVPPAPEAPPPRRPRASFFAKDRTWLNVLLFVLTCGSVFLVGISWGSSWLYAEKLAADPEFQPAAGLFADARVLGLSLIYTIVLLVILTAHEMGHYLMSRRYGLSATLPFFIPAPSMIGTLGAFIKIRSPITRKLRLFDVGIAGPLAGFVPAVFALFIGLAFSKIVPSLPHEEALIFGEPLLLKIAGLFLLKDAGPGFDVVLHPAAFAGWIGLLVTALNLLPLGQLDGGHIAFSVLRGKTRRFSIIVLVLLAVMGLVFWVGWLVWVLMLLTLGLRHPQIWDEATPLGRKRTTLLVCVIAIFILCFIPAPVKGYNILDLIRMMLG